MVAIQFLIDCKFKLAKCQEEKKEEFNSSQSNLLSQKMFRAVANIIVLKLTFIILYPCYCAYKILMI